ncbi:DUF92 domain-containing protein [Cytophagaceae bacterium ABcell3]|nr:DUF92 domain-containing protein [Cytophagaceae bacterium ABcell3]
MNTSIWLLAGAQVFSIWVSVFSYRKKSVSTSGFTAMLLISALFIWTEQLSLLTIVFLMFASSSLLSKFKKSEKQHLKTVVEKHGARDYIQALANLGTATGLIVLNYFFPNDLMVVAAIGSIAAANADSWASETGSLSTSKPVLITTFKPIPKGLSGGITLTGTLGGIAGAWFIVFSSILILPLASSYSGNLNTMAIAVFLAGVFGLFLDSWLGAICQALYKNKDTYSFTENPTGNTSLVKGVVWINNDLINFISTVSGAVVAGSIYYSLV